MVLLTVKIRLMAVTLPAMIMMEVTVKVVVAQLVVILVAVNPVETVNLISHHTDLSAVIQPGMSMVLTVVT